MCSVIIGPFSSPGLQKTLTNTLWLQMFLQLTETASDVHMHYLQSSPHKILYT